MKFALLAAATIAGLCALHRLALWMESKGWIFYKHTSASSTARSNAFMQVQALWEPQAQYVVEERSYEDAVESESGDGGNPGKGLPRE